MLSLLYIVEPQITVPCVLYSIAHLIPSFVPILSNMFDKPTAAAEPAKATRRATGAPLQTDCANAILSKVNVCVTASGDRPRVRQYSRAYHIRFILKK